MRWQQVDCLGGSEQILVMGIIMIKVGCGVDFIQAIQNAIRAIVFISVPWSSPERQGRVIFQKVVEILESEHLDIGVESYRLEVDEDEIAQQWLANVGYPDYAILGAGSLLWLQTGRVIITERNCLQTGVSGIVTRSLSLWESL
jgi:hypothetical protein